MPSDAQTDRILDNVTVEVAISVGRARPTMGALSRLDVNEVLMLDTAIDDPVELYVGNRLIAEGVLEELNGEDESGVGVRITRVLHQQTPKT